MRLRQALEGCSTGQLGRIAAAWGLPTEPGTLRRELVERLADRIAAGADDPATWERVSADALDVVRLLVRAGGRHELDLLTRRLERAAPSSAEGWVDAAVTTLLERGLVFRLLDADPQRRGVYILLPDEVLEAAERRIGDEGGLEPLESRPAPAELAGCDLRRDLFVLASALRRERWGAASRGLAGKRARTVGQILTRLRATAARGPGEAGRRWRFLLWVAQRAGWISRDDLPRPDDDQIERLLEGRASLARLALSAGAPPEPDARHGREGGTRRLQAEALALLSELDMGTWYAPQGVIAYLAEELGADQDVDATRPRAARSRVAATLERWLMGRWYWLGLVRWGADGGAWSGVATSPALRELARDAPRDPTTERQSSPCHLDAAASLIAPPDADLAALYRAERYLSFRGGDDERRYSLTPASFDRGVRLGGDAAELLELLSRLTADHVPAETRADVVRWASGDGRLSLNGAVILSAERTEDLDAALGVVEATGAVESEPTAYEARVRPDGVAGLLAALAEAGIPVDVDAGLRAEPTVPGRAAALADGGAEAAWVALEVLRRLAPEVTGAQRDLQDARARLEGILPAATLAALDRRATTILAAIAERRRRSARRRVV